LVTPRGLDETEPRSGSFLESIELHEDRYVGLLEKLIGETVHLQNNPAEVSRRCGVWAGG
jgi:hypothetical protein